MNEESRTTRRLAAILAADVVGYSRLMGIDEEGSSAALRAHRKELIDPLIAQHQGRIFKTTGDGLLIEFASIVDAVRCAIVIQQGIESRGSSGSLQKEILCDSRGNAFLHDQDPIHVACWRRAEAGG